MASPLFDPRDVKVAALFSAVAAGGNVAFAAPANNNANKHRYLLAVSFGNVTVTSQNPVALEDINGNLLVESAVWTPSHVYVLSTPLVVGVPNANGLRVRNLGALAQDYVVWVQFADVQAPILPTEKFAVSI